MPPVQSKKPVTQAPKLTNRGGAGLLNKAPAKQDAEQKPIEKPQKTAKFKIAPSLSNLIVKIDTLTPDPDNARLHPERNMQAIIDSLQSWGQTKPIVVNSRTRIVVAGNGTLAAAKSLGWTEIAVSYVDMTDAEAAAYGLADNRTAELAKWDFEVMARLDKLIQEQDPSNPMAGWSVDELQVLRAAEWTPPVVEERGGTEGNGSGEGDNSLSDVLLVNFSPEEYEQVKEAITRMRTVQGNDEMSQAACLRLICQEWSKAEQCGRLEGLDEVSASFDNEDDMSEEDARMNGLTEEG